MRNPFRSLSFRHKIILHAGVVSVSALLLACTSFVAFDQVEYRSSIARKILEEAEIIAANSTAAISYRNSKDAEEILAALNADPHIAGACLYDQAGELFVHNAKSASFKAPIVTLDTPLFRIENESLHVVFPVILDREHIGTVYILRDLKDLNQRAWQFGKISAAVLLLAMLTSTFLSIYFQRIISRPVTELATAVRQVTDTEDYSVRARKLSEDELGTFTDGLNEMLSQIQARDHALQEGQEQLELRVQTRTQDLNVAKNAAEASARSLRESEERIRAIMDTAADGILTVNDQDIITTWNRSAHQIFGYPANEIIGQNVSILISGAKRGKDDLKSRRDSRSAAGVALGQEWETDAIRKNGSVFPVALRISRMRFRDESIHIWVCQDIEQRKKDERELVRLNQELVAMARQAGMADVATGVLHNVGNVLNSVNVSANLVEEQIRQSRLQGLIQAVKLIRSKGDQVGAFISEDPKGKMLPRYLASLSAILIQEQQGIAKELRLLRKNIEHIKDIVSMHQSYAVMVGVREQVAPAELVEDALNLNAAELQRHEISIIKSLGEVPLIEVDKQKVLQILVNLIQNAKYALLDAGRPDRDLTLSTWQAPENKVILEVRDNGVGLEHDRFEKIFAHGYTTRKGGHGFGLHTSALAARELKGSLTVHSDGLGKGCAFRLTLPASPSPDEKAMRSNSEAPEDS